MAFTIRSARWLVPALAFVALLPGAKDSGCSNDDVSIGDDTGQGGQGAGGQSIEQSFVLGECAETHEPGYCDAEVLRWTYDAVEERLTLEDRRMELNCCGERSWAIENNGERYIATQTDAPEVFEGQEARCNCMCVFDFTLTAESIPLSSFDLDIIRDVTDAGSPRTVFSGTLDLTQSAGEVVLDETPATFCDLQ